MSKVYGLAGLRIGYAIGHPETIAFLSKHTLPASLTLSQPAIAATIAALKDQDFVTFYKGKNEESKQILSDFLSASGIEFYKSYANLMLFALDKFPSDFLKKVEQGGILVREVTDKGQRFCRVSTAKPEDMHQFVGILKQMLA